MSVALIDPNLIHSNNKLGKAVEPVPDALDVIIAKINEVIGTVGPVPTGTRQVFLLTRQAGDTDTIIVNAARGLVGRASAGYNVQGTFKVNSLGVGVVSIGAQTAAQFTLTLTSAWAVGDSIMFTVEDLS